MYKWLLTVLALLLTACPVFSFHNAPAIPIEYRAAGVCQGVELTNNNADGRWSIHYMRRPEPHNTNLPSGQAVRVPDPNPSPELTLYVISRELMRIGSEFEVDLSWRCLPDKQPERVRFTYRWTREGLVITEDASLASGLRIVQESRNAW